MEIRQLKRFLDLCKTQNFTQSAINLFLSQQALSSSMTALEKELRKTLFQRTPKGAVLTQEGRILRELCEPVVRSFDDMETELGRRLGIKKGVLLMGLVPSVLRASSPDLLLQFRTAYPHVRLQAIECMDTKCLRIVVSGAVDLAFAPRPTEEHPRVEYIPFRKDKICAIVKNDHPFAKKEKLYVKELEHETLVTFNKNYYIYHKFMNRCREEGFEPYLIVDSSESTLLLDMAKNHGYVFICMEYIARDIDKNHLVSIPLADEGMIWEYGILCRKGKALNRSSQNFLEFMAKNAEEV